MDTTEARHRARARNLESSFGRYVLSLFACPACGGRLHKEEGLLVSDRRHTVAIVRGAPDFVPSSDRALEAVRGSRRGVALLEAQDTPLQWFLELIGRSRSIEGGLISSPSWAGCGTG
jgi:hypothetical protein